jgi:hypothetical protein
MYIRGSLTQTKQSECIHSWSKGSPGLNENLASEAITQAVQLEFPVPYISKSEGHSHEHSTLSLSTFGATVARA